MQTIPDSLCYLNGEYASLREAKVSVLDRGFIFGDGVYELVPVYRRRPFRLPQHLARLQRSLDGIRLANPDLQVWVATGDGDSLSIGFGQFGHAIRRNLNMLYLIENNGVYGLTKGQFSASADVGSRAKKGETNQQPPIGRLLADYYAYRGWGESGVPTSKKARELGLEE